MAIGDGTDDIFHPLSHRYAELVLLTLIISRIGKWRNWIMNLISGLVSGHNRQAGSGSVSDGAVWRGAVAKMLKMCGITWNNEGAYDRIYT